MSLPTEKRVMDKIKQLVDIGVRRIPEMQRHIRHFVQHELFSNSEPPPVTDGRFWPSSRSVMNCIYRTAPMLTYVDMFCNLLLVSIAKYFRNRHLPAAWFKDAGGSKLTLPIDVRWNTNICDAIQSFLKNRGILVQICQDHKDSIDRTISNLVNDVAFAAKAKTYMELMMPIYVALDQAQQSGTTIAVSVEIWHKLGLDLLEQATSAMKLSRTDLFNIWPRAVKVEEQVGQRKSWKVDISCSCTASEGNLERL